ncbi:hypothetical protein HF086_011197, partial [Spodoptera exigua]
NYLTLILCIYYFFRSDNMRINILSSIILILLANDSCADEQKKQNSLITTYDPGASSTVGSNLQNYGQISRNDKPPDRPIKFEDGPEGQELIDNNKVDSSLFLADISFDNEEDLSNNNHINDIRQNRKNTEKKIKFEENDDINDDIDDDQEDDDFQRSTGKVVFEENGTNEDDAIYADESERGKETVAKPIKFENQESRINIKNQETVTERVAFIDDSYQKQELFRKKTRKSRKPRYQTKQPSQDPTYPHSPYRESSYPNYQGAASGYPVPAHSALGFSYPGYPTPYPGTPLPTPLYPGGAFPTFLYPGYPTPSYPSYQYPPTNPGYGGNPPQSYQSQYPDGPRPQSNPIVYPTPAP